MPEKVYHSIGEAASILGVNASTLRYWESEFRIIKPHKNKKGNRLYTARDIENLKFIKKLLKEEGFTISGAKEHLKARLPEVEKEGQIVETLERVKGFLLEVKKNMEQ